MMNVLRGIFLGVCLGSGAHGRPQVPGRSLIVLDFQFDYFNGADAAPNADAVRERLAEVVKQPFFRKVIWVCQMHPEFHATFTTSHALEADTIKEVSDNAFRSSALEAVVYEFDFEKKISPRPRLLGPATLTNYPGARIPRQVKLQRPNAIAGTLGAQMLMAPGRGDPMVLRGQLPGVDSLSGFGTYPEVTVLGALLGAYNIDTIYLAGHTLAGSVYHTAKNALSRGFKVVVLEDAVTVYEGREISTIREELIDGGAAFVHSLDLKPRIIPMKDVLAGLRDKEVDNSKDLSVSSRTLPGLDKNATEGPKQEQPDIVTPETVIKSVIHPANELDVVTPEKAIGRNEYGNRLLAEAAAKEIGEEVPVEGAKEGLEGGEVIDAGKDEAHSEDDQGKSDGEVTEELSKVADAGIGGDDVPEAVSTGPAGVRRDYVELRGSRLPNHFETDTEDKDIGDVSAEKTDKGKPNDDQSPFGGFMGSIGNQFGGIPSDTGNDSGPKYSDRTIRISDHNINIRGRTIDVKDKVSPG